MAQQSSNEARPLQLSEAAPPPPPPPNPVHNDGLLESVLSHLPLPDLVPASHVSTSWKCSVSSSLSYVNPPKPWLLLHKLTTDSPPYKASSHAYDPRSRVWYDITLAGDRADVYFSTLRPSGSRVLYVLSPSRFSLSLDPLHVTWRHLDPPRMWRIDPVVAVVGGRYVVVAGGTFDFEDDPLGVEVYDLESKQWETAESMPLEFMGYSASALLSVTAGPDHLYVAEKRSGVTYKFDPRTMEWLGPYVNRQRDNNLCCCAIGFCRAGRNGDENDESRLIMVGVTQMDGQERVSGVKLWELDERSLEIRREMGEMPKELVQKLRGKASSARSSISVSFGGELVYVVNCLAPKEVFVCDIGGEGSSKWASVENPVVGTEECSWLKERLVFTCSDVGLADLERAIVHDKCKFRVI